MTWITALKSRFGFNSRRKDLSCQKGAPVPEAFPPTCPLRPAVEPTHSQDRASYLVSLGNRPETIARLDHVLKMDAAILELGCGNAEIAWQIASQNPSIGVIATDIYRSPCLTGSVSGYAKASRAWTNGLLKAQILAPGNLVILRAGACLLSLLPPESINTILLVNPEPAVGRAFLKLLTETPTSRRAVRPGSNQLVIKPFSKKMGITTCGGYEFSTEADWSRGIGFMRDSPFVFKDAPRIQWHVDLGVFSDYSRNSTQAGVSVCGNIRLPSQSVKTLVFKDLPANRPTHKSGNI
ncbi:MAG: hypothetical protein GY697_08855 [Desulfobacterales bacterium]|nr:hypothetical protein [Desulfobacterales bacterium]